MNSRRFNDRIASDAPAKSRQRNIELIEISQRVRRTFCNRSSIGELALGMPKKTLMRHLEELEAQQVLRHIPADKRGDFGYEKGQADMWQAIV
jgi:hypothetical protein